MAIEKAKRVKIFGWLVESRSIALKCYWGGFCFKYLQQATFP